MSFASPWALLFLLAIPPVIALYFLRLKRREVTVSSTLLWSRVLEDRRVNSPFQRFRRSLLLLLQILGLLLFALALARPQRITTWEMERRHVILVDVSASMGAVEQGARTRLDEAKRMAHEYVEALGAGERAVLIRFASGSRVLTSTTTDHSALHSAIDALEVIPAPSRIDGALMDAIGIVQSAGSASGDQTVDAVGVIFSDGGFPDAPEVELPLFVDYRPVGSARESSGIVALASRRDYSRGSRPQVFIEVRNSGATPARGALSVFQGEALLRAAEPEAPIAPGAGWAHSFEADADGLVRVLWEPEGADALAADNEAWIVLAGARDIQCWRIGEANYFLEEALAALPNVLVRDVAAADLERELANAAPPPELLIWDRVPCEALPAGPAHLFFGARPREIWGELSSIEAPPVIAWDRSHPVNRFLNLSRLRILNSPILADADGVTHLLETSGGALISAFHRRGAKGVVVAFDLLATDWPLDISFPLFLHNAIGFLTGEESGPAAGLRCEELLAVRAPVGAREFRLEKPDGAGVPLAIDADRWVRYADTVALGPYRVAWRETGEDGAELEAEAITPVNLLAPEETDLDVRSEVKIAGRTITAQKSTQTRDVEYWPWLLAAALVLLLLEWYCFHLR